MANAKRVIRRLPAETKTPVVVKKTKVAKQAKPIEAVAAQPRQSATRHLHSIQSAYGGPSPVLTQHKSRTPLRTDEFGTAPDLIMSERDDALLRPLKSKHKRGVFVAGDADRGILNRAIRKGLLRHVGGDATHETAELQFVG